MSTSTPPSSTSTSLSADELREIVAEAKAWTDNGALINIPTNRLLGGLSNLQEGYAEGVIAERLRGRELRALVDDLLARAFRYDDKPHQLYSQIALIAQRFADAEDRDEIARLMDIAYRCAGSPRDELTRALIDALLNMRGAFDTPVTRRHRPFNEFQEGAVASMRDALELVRKAGLLEGGEK